MCWKSEYYLMIKRLNIGLLVLNTIKAGELATAQRKLISSFLTCGLYEECGGYGIFIPKRIIHPSQNDTVHIFPYCVRCPLHSHENKKKSTKPPLPFIKRERFLSESYHFGFPEHSSRPDAHKGVF